MALPFELVRFEKLYINSLLMPSNCHASPLTYAVRFAPGCPTLREWTRRRSLDETLIGCMPVLDGN
jgi:hypothetical protein